MANQLLFIAGSDIDYYYDVESFLGAGDACIAKPLGSNVGGCVLNAASVCAILGSNVKVLDYLKANDEGTDLLINELNNHHVDTSDIKYGEDVINGSCLIMKNGNEKCIYVIDPKKPFYEEDSNLKQLLFNSKYIYSLMAIINKSFKNLSLLKEAKNNGTKVIFDGGSQYNNQKEVDTLLDLTNGLFINKTAYQRLKDICQKEPLDLLFEKNLEFACITDGDKGATCYTKEKIYKKEIYKVDVVDSTGAGDSFAGCFLHFLSQGYSYEDCLNYASANGAYACLNKGGMAGAISQTELLNFINNRY